MSSSCLNKLWSTGCLKQQEFIFHRFGGWQVQDQGANQFLLSENFLSCFCSHTAQKVNKLYGISSYKGTNPTMRAPCLLPHLNLLSSPKSLLQILLYWGLGLQHMNGGWGHNSVLSTWYWLFYCGCVENVLVCKETHPKVLEGNGALGWQFTFK